MLRALVVEDELALQMLYGSVLREAGFGVARALDGNQAIEYLQANLPPQLIILDIRMPQSNGCDVLEYLQTYKGIEQVHVVIASASSEFSRYVDSVPSAEFILKPIVLPPLRAIARRYQEASQD